MSTGPVETKVTAATLGASTSALVLWALEQYVFTGSTVPAPVAGFAELIILAGCTFGAGWLARHTPRSDPDALPKDSPGRPPLR